MPKSKGEATKKHGDKMEPFIERTGGNTPRERPDESVDDDPTMLRNDTEEDVQNDDVENPRNVGERR
jgi:hypothetical protein